jgi:Icc-related predicted phosphoesterase
MRIIAISDTHGKHDMLSIPDGDVLLVAGDITSRGHIDELWNVARWFKKQPHKVIAIAGNHDFCLENNFSNVAELALQENDVLYLKDSSVVIDGIKFYGSPWQPWFYDWAFNLRRGNEIAEKWSLIDEDTDILITHGPAKNILDSVANYMVGESKHVGCNDLAKRIEVIGPKLHLGGHIHEAYGVEKHGETWYVNASVLDLNYKVANKPIIIDIDESTKQVIDVFTE